MLTLVPRRHGTNSGVLWLVAWTLLVVGPAAAPAEPPRRTTGTPTLAPPPPSGSESGAATTSGESSEETPKSRPNKLRMRVESELADEEEPRSVIRMGKSTPGPATGDAGAARKPVSPPARQQADAPPGAPSVPGRIQPHNPKPVTLDAKKLIARAYKLSQTAASEDDFTQILTLGRQAAALDQDPQAAAYGNQLMAWAYDHRGQLLSQQAGDLAADEEENEAQTVEQRALADYDQAVRLDPTRWRAVHNRGVSFALLGKPTYELALNDFDRTIQLAPKFYKAWFNRAEIRRELGRHEEALADYQQALRLRPGDVLAHRGRGHTHYCLGQLHRALEDFNKVVELEPQNVLARVDRADLCTELGQWETAATDYQQALKLDDRFGRAYLGAAWLMATCPDQRIRHAKFAVQSAEKAIELDGADSHQYLDTLAAAYASAGMFAEAKAAAQRAVELAPDGKKPGVKNRLVLYEQEQPFRQSERNAKPAGPTEP